MCENPVKKIPSENAYPTVGDLQKMDVVDRQIEDSHAENPIPALILASHWARFDAAMSELQLKVRFLARMNDRPAFDGLMRTRFGVSQVSIADAVPGTAPAVRTLLKFPLMAAAVSAEILESEIHLVAIAAVSAYLAFGVQSFKSRPAPLTLTLTAPVEGELDLATSSKDKASTENTSVQVPCFTAAVKIINNVAPCPVGVLHIREVLLVHRVA